MNETCPTVKVKADNEQGFAVINEADFDAKVHEHFASEEEHEDDAPKKRGRPAKGKE